MIENNNMNNIQDNNEELPQNPQQYFDINVNNINNNNNELYQNPQSLSQAQANIINNLQNQEDQNTNNNFEENFNNNNNDYLEEPEQQKIDTIPTQNKSHPSLLNNNNNINNNNNLNKNISQNNTISNNKSNKNLNYSRISKSNSQMGNNNQNFFQNFDIQALTYSLNKDYNQLHISKDEKFLERMKFDVYKRQIREDRINKLIEQNKPTIDEEERIKAFNRLIEDANRRIEAQENLENMKNKLEEDITQAPSKKYKAEEWDDIYKKRFKQYEEESRKKKEEIRKEKIEQEKKKEEDVINMCKVKKAPMKHIEEASKRMYKESIKRKLKMQEKINRINNNLYEDDPNKYKKIVKSEAYSFMSDNEDGGGYNINNMFNQNPYRNVKKISKKKGQAVTEFNNKRFDTRKNYNYNSNNNKYNMIFKNTFNPMENNNFINNNNNNINYNNQMMNNENLNNNNLNEYLEDENEIKDIPQPVMREYNEDSPMDIKELEEKNLEISAIKRLNNNNNNIQKDYYNQFQKRALNSQKLQNNINNYGENEASKIVDQFFIQKNK